MDLFGGALKMNLPADFEDVSGFRDIPDHQEVFVHKNTDQSLIVEIVDYTEVADDGACAYFFQDLAGANGATMSEVVKKVGPLCMESKDDRLSIFVCEGTQTVAKFNEKATNVVRIYLAAIRIPSKGTDILVTLNCPEKVDPVSSDAAAPPEVNQFDTFLDMVKSFCVEDWNLFT